MLDSCYPCKWYIKKYKDKKGELCIREVSLGRKKQAYWIEPSYGCIDGREGCLDNNELKEEDND